MKWGPASGLLVDDFEHLAAEEFFNDFAPGAALRTGRGRVLVIERSALERVVVALRRGWRLYLLSVWRMLAAPLVPVAASTRVAVSLRLVKLERADREGIRGTVTVLRALSDTQHVGTQGPVWQLDGQTV